MPLKPVCGAVASRRFIDKRLFFRHLGHFQESRLGIVPAARKTVVSMADHSTRFKDNVSENSAKQPARSAQLASASCGRRDWLRGMTGACITLSLGSVLPAAVSSAEELRNWLQAGADFLGDRTTLGHLGAAYLQTHPEEGDLRRLSTLIVDGGFRSIELRLLEKISQDWDGHKIATVQGWVMARTEARLCAALNLVDGGRA